MSYEFTPEDQGRYKAPAGGDQIKKAFENLPFMSVAQIADHTGLPAANVRLILESGGYSSQMAGSVEVYFPEQHPPTGKLFNTGCGFFAMAEVGAPSKPQITSLEIALANLKLIEDRTADGVTLEEIASLLKIPDGTFRNYACTPREQYTPIRDAINRGRATRQFKIEAFARKVAESAAKKQNKPKPVRKPAPAPPERTERRPPRIRPANASSYFIQDVLRRSCKEIYEAGREGKSLTATLESLGLKARSARRHFDHADAPWSRAFNDGAIDGGHSPEPRRHAKRVTEDQIEVLRQMARAGFTQRQACAALNIKFNTFRVHLRKFPEIAQAWAAGLSDRAAATAEKLRIDSEFAVVGSESGKFAFNTLPDIDPAELEPTDDEPPFPRDGLHEVELSSSMPSAEVSELIFLSNVRYLLIRTNYDPLIATNAERKLIDTIREAVATYRESAGEYMERAA